MPIYIYIAVTVILVTLHTYILHFTTANRTIVRNIPCIDERRIFTVQTTNKDVIIQTTKRTCMFIATLFCCFCLLVALLVAVLSVLVFMYYTGYSPTHGGQQPSGLHNDALSLMMTCPNVTELQDKVNKNKLKKGGAEVKSKPAGVKIDEVNAKKTLFPVNFMVPNFTKKMKNGKKWFSGPFFAYEGYETRLRVDADGNGYGRGTHISVFLKTTKDSNDTLYFLRNGYLVIELISQSKFTPHKLKVVAPHNHLCRTCGNIITKSIGTTYWLGFTDFVSIELVRTYYLKDDGLHFRVTYSKYFWYIDAVLLHIPDVPVVVLSAVVSGVVIYWLLMSLEYAAFCTVGSSALLPSCSDFTIDKIKQFLLTKQNVVLHTCYVVIYSTALDLIKYALTIVMEVVCIAAGELLYWDMPTASDNVVPTLMTVRRVSMIIVFSMIINHHVMSQGVKIIIVHPVWLIKAYSYAVTEY